MRRIFGVVVATGIAVLLATPAWAESGPPMMGAGTGEVTHLVITPNGTADGNTFVTVDATGMIFGAFTGTFHEKDREVIHADGSVNIEGTGMQSGSQGACGAGSFTYRVEAQGPSVLTFSGKVRSIDAATNTSGIHAVQDFVAAGATFTYTAKYTCG